MASNPNLYALIVGIDDYQKPVGKLRGCVPDATSIQQYLNDHEKANYNLKIVTRFNAEATRGNIMDGFTKHLAAATENDVVLFFYAGHGAQEQADPSVWVAEPSKKLEGLVLYDSIPEGFKNSKLLADKELRYLLHYISTRNEKGEKKKSPHIVVITDCCHSGENTRGGDFNDTLLKRHFERGDGSLPQRAWTDFMFASDKNITPQKLATMPINDIFPLAPHIAMAACQSNELASEQSGHGVFTLNLIDILTRSGGQVTYRDLQNRIANYLKNQFPQTPQIYASTDKNDLFKVFLGKKGGSKPMYANVLFNETRGWVMDMGAMHGVSNQVKGVKITSFDNKLTVDAAIGKIFTNTTALNIADVAKLDKKAQYKGIIEGFMSAPVAIFIDNLDGNKAMEKDLRDHIDKEGKNLNIASKEDIADYAVRIFDGKYVITNRVDTDLKVKFKPIVMPTKDAELAFDDLNHISQFEFVKRLENSGDNKMNLENVIVAFVENGKTKATPIVTDKGKEVLDIAYASKNDEGAPRCELKVSVTNNDDKPLYVSLLYFSTTFGVTSELLASGVQLLEKKGDTVFVFDGDVLGLDCDPTVQMFNLPSCDSIFKLIVSRQPFDVTAFSIADLPSSAELMKKMRGDTTRGLTRISAKAEAADAWATRTIVVRNANPNFDKDYKNKPAKLKEWLDTEGGAFLKKLY
jgi:hypothetical protein